MKQHHNFFAQFLALAVVSALSESGYAQLKIVDYNTAGIQNTSAMQTVIQAISDGNENLRAGVTQVVKPIDIIVLEELSSGDIGTMLTMLNNLHVGTYIASSVGTTTGAGGVGMIYRSESVDLLEQTEIIPANVGGVERGVQRFKLQPDGYDSTAAFYIYGSHYKASDTGADASQRSQEAAGIRANSDALGQGAHIIYAGDFNIYRSTEPMWTALTGAGNGQAFDPVNQVGTWHDNSAFINVHTQSPCTSGCGVTGGVDDRFDWQMVSGEMMDNEGMSIITSTYHTFGNNGTHQINQAITTGTGAPAAVLTALATATDHLPVVAEYQVPAKMSVAVSTVLPKVIVGASLAATVTVSNSAGDMQVVTNTVGADELDYTVSGTGATSGSANGTDAAFGGSNNHNFNLDTTAAGAKTATFTTNATSPQVPNPNSVIGRSYTVVAHSSPSFATDSNTTSLTYDFGAVAVGSSSPTFDFSLFNRSSNPSLTAALDFDSVMGPGSTTALTTNLVASAGTLSFLAGGASHAFAAMLNTSTIGSFSATYTLSLSDENLLGATSQSLTLMLMGQITSNVLAGDYNNDGNVDAADYVVWRKSATNGTPLVNNETASIGITDDADFAAWRSNFGASGGTGAGAGLSASVPEPTGLGLLFVAILAIAPWRKAARLSRHSQTK